MSDHDELARISSQLSSLMDGINASSQVYADGSLDLKTLREKLAAQNERISDRRFRLAFAGASSVAKSQLVSLFVGRPGLLPLADGPKGVATCVRKGTRDAL